MTPHTDDEIVDRALNEKHYYIQACDACPFLISVPGIGSVTTLSTKYPIAYENIIEIVENNFALWVYTKKDLAEIFTHLTTFGTLEKILGEWENDRKRFVDACRKVEKTDLTKLDDPQLLELYDEFYESNLGVWALALLADAVNLEAEPRLMGNLTEFLKKRGKEKLAPKYYAALTVLDSFSFAVREKLELLDIAEKKKAGKDVAAKLETHANKWFWVKNSYLDARRLTAEQFCNDAEEILKTLSKPRLEKQKIIARQKAALEEKKRLMEELALPADAVRLISVINGFGAWQDERKKYGLIANHYLMLFLREAARRTNMSADLAKYSLPTELPALLSGKLGAEELRERSKGIVVVFAKGLEIVRTGSWVEKAKKAVFGSEDEGRYEEVRGTCASIGKAQGISKIIKKATDIHKMSRGDVLVSSMTRPELIPAMKLAAAVVTDEGGATCHAAIVSREFGIPCVVGTRIATRVLKDGDLVEVNANHGVVKKIKVEGEEAQGAPRGNQQVPPGATVEVNANHGVVKVLKRLEK